MVAIAIAAAVVVYYITMDVVTQQGAQLQQQATAAQEVIVIDAVKATYDATTNTYTVGVYVRNTGDTTVTVNAAYVLEGDTVVCENTAVNTPIDSGAVDKILVPNCSLTAGNTYTVKVTTTGGAVAQKTFTA